VPLHAEIFPDRAESSRGEMVDLLCDLVRCRTSPPAGAEYGALLDVLERRLDRLGLPYREVVLDESAENLRALLVELGGEGKPLYFHGHYDVVRGDDHQFEPFVSEGKVWGRGSSDMKSGLVSMIYAAKFLSDSNALRDGRVVLCIVPDEETGGMRGTQRLFEKGLILENAWGMLTPEPTSGRAWNASKGGLSLRITLKGRAVHAAEASAGKNAFEQMVVTAQMLMRYAERVGGRRTSFPVFPADAARSSAVVGGECGSGVSFNQVPGEAFFTLDRRTNPEEDLDEEEKVIVDILEAAKRKGVELEYRVIQKAYPSESPEGSELARALRKAVREAEGREVSFTLCPGVLETRFYHGLGLPAYAYGPGILEVSHGPEEYVEIDRMVRLAAVYAAAAGELFRGAGHRSGSAE